MPGSPHDAGNVPSRPILALVAEGRWGHACEAAVGALARSELDLDALGRLGIGAAAASDRTAAGAALSRLRDVEPAPAFHARILRGILELQDEAADRARAPFDAALALRPGDALATCVVGEVQHAARSEAGRSKAGREADRVVPGSAQEVTALRACTGRGGTPDGRARRAAVAARRRTRACRARHGCRAQQRQPLEAARRPVRTHRTAGARGSDPPAVADRPRRRGIGRQCQGGQPVASRPSGQAGGGPCARWLPRQGADRSRCRRSATR